MRPDIVASYRIEVQDLSTFDPTYLAEDAKMIKGVRDAATVDLVEGNAFALDVRFHGQTEQSTAESIANRILSALERDKLLSEVRYEGLLGHEEAHPGIAWTGRDDFESITLRHNGAVWVRADYFIHALSHEDLGIRDVNYEHMIIESLRRWPQQTPAREAVRRMREMYALVEQVRDLANLPVEIDDAVVEAYPIDTQESDAAEALEPEPAKA